MRNLVEKYAIWVKDNPFRRASVFFVLSNIMYTLLMCAYYFSGSISSPWVGGGIPFIGFCVLTIGLYFYEKYKIKASK